MSACIECDHVLYSNYCGPQCKEVVVKSIWNPEHGYWVDHNEFCDEVNTNPNGCPMFKRAGLLQRLANRLMSAC